MGSAPTNDPADAPLHVVLVTPEIPWNTGNAGRTCLAVGARLHLIEPLGFSLDEKRLRRAGLDYWSRVPLTVWDDWPAFADRLPELGEPYFFSAEAPHTIWDAELSGGSVLVFGSETEGLPVALRNEYAERLYSIPMKDDSVRSLNLSTAVGIASYEAARQRLSSGVYTT